MPSWTATGCASPISRKTASDKKWEAFGWEVIGINGHSFEEIKSAVSYAGSPNLNKPLLIIADTIKGKGVSFMESVPLWHGLAPRGDDAERAMAELVMKEEELS